MKQIFLIILTILFSGAQSQNTYVPDDNFEQALIDLGYDSGVLNDSVPTSNINSLTVLSVPNNYINDLTGIEDFVGLTILSCHGNNLTALNISSLTNLTSLNCISNQLTTLNISSLTNLTSLNCSSNQITTLNISSLTNLTILNCSSNQLASIDMINNTLLEFLNISSNQISNVDLTQNTGLETFKTTSNQLTNLNINNNSQIQNLYINNNFIQAIDVSHLGNLKTLFVHNNLITHLDVSLCPLVENIAAINNQLEYLNLKSGGNNNLLNLYATGNPNLHCINVDDSTYSANNWTIIDVQTNFGEYCYCSHQSSTINEELCFGSSYIVPSGSDTLLTTQQYIDTISTVDGCDSIITINLIVRSLDGWSINETICSDSYYITPYQNDTLFSTGFYFDTLQNSFACDSIITINLTVNPITSESINVSICNGESYTTPSGMNSYNTTGQYFDTLQNQYTCDSIIEINLLVEDVDLNINIDANKLTIAESAVAYQWINCATNEIIEGATEQNYFAEYNGSFACSVSKNTCTYESSCVDVNNVSINDLSNNYISVFPNPVSNILNIISTKSILNIRLYNLEGKELFQTNKNFIDMSNYSAGLYMVVIESNMESNKFKILKINKL